MACSGVGIASGGEGGARLELSPPELFLDGARAEARAIATLVRADGTLLDVTDAAEWFVSGSGSGDGGTGLRLDAPGRVVMSGSGLDGVWELRARYGGLEAGIPARASRAGETLARSFEHELLPALTKAGCNMGTCHGTPSGKNGFRLSLRGFDPELDFRTLAREAGTRRVNPMAPDASLVLLKGRGEVAHEGGRRFGWESLTHRIARDWIAEGAKAEPEGAPRPLGIEIWPGDRVLDAPADVQRFAARARFSDGSVRDVTRLARYESTNLDVARVDEEGLARKTGRGETTILVNFENFYATARLVFREPVPGLAWTDPPENNPVDTHVFAKLKLLGIPPSELSDDATFLRRAYLDAIGVPPTVEEARAFLSDDRADKRARLIDALLERDEYADHWALKWSALLGGNQRFAGHKGAYAYHRWIRSQIAANVPYDRFAASVVTARGSNYTNPEATFYRRYRTPEEATEAVGQLFLGLRLQCAKCHNHVADRWTQDDYHGMAAFFSQVRFKDGPQAHAQYDKEETVYAQLGEGFGDRRGRRGGGVEWRHPRTGRVMTPTPPGGEPIEVPADEDRREALAAWMVSPENPYFDKAAVNRIWYHLTGRGIVEPVDDARSSNPPASAELLDWLARDFAEGGRDVKRTIRTIMNSRTYQLDSVPNLHNEGDEVYFSKARARLLDAESLLDAISQALEVPEKLFHLPEGTRAAQIPDGEFKHPFLRAFGQPERSLACECERQSDSTLEQALQIMGGRTVSEKLTAPENRLGRLLASGASDGEMVETLFLATLCRPPRAEESEIALDALARAGGEASARRSALEDLAWSLLNHPEFLFRH